jgi:hypothetical protein
MLESAGIPYSYGFAIILLTIMVKAATYPLSQKQARLPLPGPFTHPCKLHTTAAAAAGAGRACLAVPQSSAVHLPLACVLLSSHHPYASHTTPPQPGACHCPSVGDMPGAAARGGHGQTTSHPQAPLTQPAAAWLGAIGNTL